MNLLPSDLQKTIGLYIPYDQTLKFCQLVQCDGQFYKTKEELEVPYVIDIKENFYTLTPYENYVRLLSYYFIILPGSEKFLSPTTCYHEAMRVHRYDIAKYFLQFIDPLMVKLNKMTAEPEPNFLYDLVTGKHPMPKTVHETLLNQIYYKKYNLIDEEKVTEEEMANALFTIYTLTGNLKNLKETFPQLPSNRSIYYILDEVRQAIPEIKAEIYVWIVKNLTPEDIRGLGTLQLWPTFFYYLWKYHGPEILKYQNFGDEGLNVAPSIIFLTINDPLFKAKVKKLLDKAMKDNLYLVNTQGVNIENVNVFLNYYQKEDDTQQILFLYNKVLDSKYYNSLR